MLVYHAGPARYKVIELFLGRIRNTYMYVKVAVDLPPYFNESHIVNSFFFTVFKSTQIQFIISMADIEIPVNFDDLTEKKSE